MNTMKNTWLRAGLGLVAAALLGGEAAEAGTTKTITVTGSSGVVPGTDPIYNYGFIVSIAAGAEFATGDSFTVTDLLGVVKSSTTFVATAQPAGPSAGDKYTFVASSTATPTDPTGATDVTWKNIGIDIINTSSSTEFLGFFFVAGNTVIGEGDQTTTTTVKETIGGLTSNLPSLTVDTGGVVSHDQVSSVPEPSSVILMMIGGAAIPCFMAIRRRSLVAL